VVETTDPRGPALERRDTIARALRDDLGRVLGVHPRELATLPTRLLARTLAQFSELNREVEALRRRVSVDELTGAMRRAAGEVALEREIDRARRRGHSLVVAFVDMDGLKAVNDSSGHAAGDWLLEQVAGVLRSRVRSYDLVIRWGGDEFLCVLPDAGLDGAHRILGQIAQTFGERTGGARFSVGIAAWNPEESASQLVARADHDLYRARRERGVGGKPGSAQAPPRAPITRKGGERKGGNSKLPSKRSA